eukprot:3840075-Lingulodinium_polyedra.AAC.1
MGQSLTQWPRWPGCWRRRAPSATARSSTTRSWRTARRAPRSTRRALWSWRTRSSSCSAWPATG